LTEEQKDRVMGINAAEFFGIPVTSTSAAPALQGVAAGTR
jgi:hypothetical protein